jgi:putative transcriptional regulator
MPVQTQVVTRVREYREKSGISQEKLAHKIGVSRQSIISIERGRYLPSLTLALRMAAYFRCPTDELFRLEQTKVLNI